jgi:ADP-ribose pyrophosphatase
MKPRKWKTLTTDIAFRTPIFNLHQRRSRHSRRGEHDFFILDAPNWVNIIPLTKSNEVVMIHQWRHGIAEFTLEIPGGMVDSSDPSPKHAARREMIEESGYDSDKILQLGMVHPNPAIQGNICFSFLATNVRQVDKPIAQGNEETEVVLVPMKEIPGLIATGAIMHALTIAAFSFMHVYNPPPHKPAPKHYRPPSRKKS